MKKTQLGWLFGCLVVGVGVGGRGGSGDCLGWLAGGLVGPWNAEEKKKKNVGAQHNKKGRYTKNEEKRNG